MDTLDESYLHNWISSTLELIMEIVSTILIVNFNRHILSFLPDAARGAIFSQAVIIKEYVLVHIFLFSTEFSVDFWMIIVKTRIERWLPLMT